MKEIELTRGFYAIIDNFNFNELNEYSWHVFITADNMIYARRGSLKSDNLQKRKMITMHQQIMDYPEKGIFIDHKNGNGLDNRIENLRLCTHQQNDFNRKNRINSFSIYKGVTFNKNKNKWEVHISIDKKQKYFGSFDSEIEAAKEYDLIAIKIQGEFAKLNFPIDKI